MPSRIATSLSMHSTSMPASCPRSTSAALRARLAHRHGRRQRHLDREMRAATDASRRPRPCGRARARSAPRSRGRARARAPPWRPDRAGEIPGRSPAAWSAECRARYRRRRCAGDRRGAGSRPARGPCGVYLIAFETRFCSSRRSSRRSDCTASEQGTKSSRRPLLVRQRRELDLELAQDFVDPQADESPASCAPVSSREMSSSAPMISSTASSEASMLPTSCDVLAAALALDQAGDVEPRGVERLQDVVAGGGEEAGLRDVGLLGARPWRAPSSVLRRVSSSVRSCTRRSSDLVGALELLGGLHARR